MPRKKRTVCLNISNCFNKHRKKGCQVSGLHGTQYGRVNTQTSTGLKKKHSLVTRKCLQRCPSGESICRLGAVSVFSRGLRWLCESRAHVAVRGHNNTLGGWPHWFIPMERASFNRMEHVPMNICSLVLQLCYCGHLPVLLIGEMLFIKYVCLKQGHVSYLCYRLMPTIPPDSAN